MKPPTIRELITEGLGYCCPHLFFTLFPSTWQTALRLGVTRRAIKYAKAKARAEGCAGCSGCQLHQLKALERAVQLSQRTPNDPPPTYRPATPQDPPGPRVVRRVAKGEGEEDD